MTNREWLNSLSDNKLATLLANGAMCAICSQKPSYKCYHLNCKDNVLLWLKAEHKENDK